jgi:hypothetical protein
MHSSQSEREVVQRLKETLSFGLTEKNHRDPTVAVFWPVGKLSNEARKAAAWALIASRRVE